MEVTLIDLGERTEREEPRRQPARPWWQIALLAAIGALVLSLTAAAPRVRGLDAPLWSVDGPRFSIGLGVIYLYADSGEVRALDIRTGRELWRTRVDGAVSGVRPTTGGMLAVTSQLYGPTGLPAPTVTLVEAATGTVGASVAAAPISATAGDPVVLTAPPSDGCADVVRCFDVFGIDPGTGRERWRISYAPDALVVWDNRPDATVRGLGLVDASGWLRRFDLTTGQELSRTRLSGWLASAEALDQSYGHVHLLFGGVVRLQPGSATLTFDSVMGGPSWSETRASPAPEWIHVYSCARWICVREDVRTTLIDPATGEVVRTVDVDLASSVGELPLVALQPFDIDSPFVDPVAPGAPQDPSLAGSTVFLDPVSGKAGNPVRGLFVPVLDSGDMTLATVTRAPGLLSDVVRIDPDGTVRTLGSIDRAAACTRAADLLVCAHPAPPGESGSWQSLRVWELPPGL